MPQRTKKIYLGKNRIEPGAEKIAGEIVHLDGEEFYRIASHDRLPPFLMSITSSSDLWMFISSNGALTAGRRNPDLALFPYYTDDKIHDSAEITGPKTIIFAERGSRTFLWEPFSERQRGIHLIQRNLYKNFSGTKVFFEEINEQLGVAFRYGWTASETFGWVRNCSFSNIGKSAVKIHVLDGLQNLLPAGLTSQFQLEKSTLADAYKKSELAGPFPCGSDANRYKTAYPLTLALSPSGGEGTLARHGNQRGGAIAAFPLPLPHWGRGWGEGVASKHVAGSSASSQIFLQGSLGLFLLSSIPVDRPEPAEALRATTVWSAGLNPRAILLSSLQLDSFRQGLPVRTESDIRAARGAYFIEAQFTLRPGKSQGWMFAADVNQGPSQIAKLRRELRSPARLQSQVEADVARSQQELWKIVASADGLQKSARPLGDARHFNNVLCNVMRGGIFCDGYKLDAADLRAFIQNASHSLAAKHKSFFRRLGKSTTRARVLQLARETNDADLERICHEYLPLTFSRRHGDPSRPWNRFSIAPRRADGGRVLNYEGNWRDIFQNWEALAVSFPGFVSGMICKFVNASTADGYNPYRVTREGFDWETHDPHDPWSHIGYWGDHQIIYLLKLLEILWRHEPEVLRDFLTREIFAYANVPYRIKPYAQLLKDPRDTVEFDATLDRSIRQRSKEIGMDGKLISDKRGHVRHVNLAEKLLVPLLAKFANFIPGAGIWLNTQRPEWNDANNALVGNGASVVTVCQLRRHLAFCIEVFNSLEAAGVILSHEVAEWFSATTRIFKRRWGERAREQDDRTRKEILDELGRAAETYRSQIYSRGLSGKKTAVAKSQILQFFSLALRAADETIRANQRADNLYHAYNLIEFDGPRGISVRRLYEMLEGQAAVLSANCLPDAKALEVLRALRKSALYRADQHSYLLYPDRQLPRFWEKNNLAKAAVARSPLLKKMLADGDHSIIEPDVFGICHFNPSFTNSRDVQRALDQLSGGIYGPLVRKESEYILDLFEKTFDHRSFTGRSGTFYGYEGLGCIYWHMVSKLLLSAQDAFFSASERPHPGDSNARLLANLAACCHDIRSGIGDYKTPENYGAFPMDPYSHTPGRGGARQPGLTGQVKEDILCRFGELGVNVSRGRVTFNPRLLRRDEFLAAPATFCYRDISGEARELRLKPGSLAFTYCQVPVVYQLARKPYLKVCFTSGKKALQDTRDLDEQNSRALFERRGKIRALVAGVQPDLLL